MILLALGVLDCVNVLAYAPIVFNGVERRVRLETSLSAKCLHACKRLQTEAIATLVDVRARGGHVEVMAFPRAGQCKNRLNTVTNPYSFALDGLIFTGTDGMQCFFLFT